MDYFTACRHAEIDPTAYPADSIVGMFVEECAAVIVNYTEDHDGRKPSMGMIMALLGWHDDSLSELELEMNGQTAADLMMAIRQAI